MEDKKIITNINNDLVVNLSKNEKEFYDIQIGRRKDLFVHMAKVEKDKLMKGGLSDEEEKLIWQYGSTLALHYINDGVGYKKRVDFIGKLGGIILLVVLAMFISDIFFNTYEKNSQVQEMINANNKELK